MIEYVDFCFNTSGILRRMLQLGFGYSLISAKLEFAKKLAALQLNDTETALFVAAIILSPGITFFIQCYFTASTSAHLQLYCIIHFTGWLEQEKDTKAYYFAKFRS